MHTMSFDDHFSGHAQIYAMARPHYPSSLFEWIAKNVPGKSVAWDCGTGTGQAAISLANYFDIIEATDPSAEQIAHATPHPKIRYSVQPAEKTDLLGDSVDVICVAQALHWFNHQDFFAEALRVLKPDGLFIAWGYNWFKISPYFDAMFNQLFLDQIKPFWPEKSMLLWNGYRDIKTPFSEIQTPEFIIESEWNFWQLLLYVQSWSAYQKYIYSGGEQINELAIKALAKAWGDPEAIKTIKMPLHIIAGRKSSHNFCPKLVFQANKF